MHPVQPSGLFKSLCLIGAAAVLTVQIWAQDTGAVPTPYPSPEAGLTPPQAAAPQPAMAKGPSSPVGGFIKGITRLMNPNAATEDQEPDDAAKLKQKVEELGGEASITKALGMGQPTDVFMSDEEIRELIGQSPRWIWRNDSEEGRPDPMLIPWVAEERIFNTKSSEAEDLENQGRLDEALEIYELMLLNLQDPTYTAVVRNRALALQMKIAERDRVSQAMGAPERVIVEPVLPAYIVEETRAIIFDRSPGGSSIVSVGEQNLAEGEEVEGFAGIKVKKIADQQVTFSVTNEYMTKNFEVEVNGNLWDEM
jgi:hypothetical protein